MVSQPPNVEIGGCPEILAKSPFCSRVIGASEEYMIRSQIISTKVITMYMEGETKH